jgi:hypothetical protein
VQIPPKALGDDNMKYYKKNGYMCNTKTDKYQHREIMEPLLLNALEELFPEEEWFVHHRDGNKTNNDIFWLFLIKALVTDKLFASALHIIDVKKSLFLKKHIYEDLIIYEIICIRETTYLYKKKEMDKLCKLSNEIPSYKTTQLILKMECAIIKGNLLNFRNLVEDNLDYIQKLPIIHLLNIYELSIFSELGYLQNEIEKLLKNNDIATYNGKEEYNIYKLLNALKIRNIFEFLKATHLLKNYDFRHIKWYLHKKKDKELIAYLESIIK